MVVKSFYSTNGVVTFFSALFGMGLGSGFCFAAVQGAPSIGRGQRLGMQRGSEHTLQQQARGQGSFGSQLLQGSDCTMLSSQ